MTISVRIFGDPKAQPRPRAFVRKTAVGPIARVYDAGTAESWKSEIATALRAHLPDDPIDSPVALDVTFVLDRPKRLRRRRDPERRIPHTGKPDAENLAKALLDCATSIKLWRDDSLVWDLHVRKVYAAKSGDRPGAEITIMWDDPTAPASLPFAEASA